MTTQNTNRRPLAALAAASLLGLILAAGCNNDQARTGAGTGGYGAGAASEASGVSAPTAAGTGTVDDGTPTRSGAGSSQLTPANPKEPAQGATK